MIYNIQKELITFITELFVCIEQLIINNNRQGHNR